MRIPMLVLALVLGACGGGSGRPAGLPCTDGATGGPYCWCMMACPGGEGHTPPPLDSPGWCVLHAGQCVVRGPLNEPDEPGLKPGCGFAPRAADTSTGVYAIYTSATGC